MASSAEDTAASRVEDDPGTPERVAWGTIAAYGPPLFALSSLLFFVQFYFLKYATDVLLLAPATVGIVFAIGRAWDAISDPIVGTWSDRTRTRIGRRRPWMLGAVPLLALTFSTVWLPPEALGEGPRLIWVTVALLAFYTAFTAYAVPHQSLGAELTTDHHDRSRVFGVNHVFFTLGMMLAFGGIQFVNNANDPRDAARTLVMVAGVVVVCVLVIPPILVRERREYLGRGSNRPLHALRDVLANPHARRLLAVQFIQLMGISVLGLLSPYVLEYVLKRPDMIAPLPAAFIVFSVGSVPFWLRLARSWGKRRAWQVSMLLFGTAFGATAFVPEGAIAPMFVLLVIAGVGAGCGGAVGPSMLADVIDYDEHKSGERKEGAYSAAWGFAIKSSNAIIILCTGFGLQAAGFVANEEQTDGVKLMLRILYGGLPFVMSLLGAWVLGGFQLNEREHARIRAELDAR